MCGQAWRRPRGLKHHVVAQQAWNATRMEIHDGKTGPLCAKFERHGPNALLLHCFNQTTWGIACKSAGRKKNCRHPSANDPFSLSPRVEYRRLRRLMFMTVAWLKWSAFENRINNLSDCPTRISLICKILSPLSFADFAVNSPTCKKAKNAREMLLGITLFHNWMSMLCLTLAVTLSKWRM